MSDFSKQYAKALYELSKEENIVESVFGELSTIEKIIDDNKGYINLIDTPAVPLAERLNLLEGAFSGCSLYVKNFLKILAEKKCFHIYKKCVKEFKALYDEDNNIERVNALTCIPLTEGQVKRLEEKLEKIVSKTVIINNIIDTDIMGGVILKLNNSQYDGSIRSRLERLAMELRQIN